MSDDYSCALVSLVGSFFENCPLALCVKRLDDAGNESRREATAFTLRGE
jgi:hypothetical protein